MQKIFEKQTSTNYYEVYGQNLSGTITCILKKDNVEVPQYRLSQSTTDLTNILLMTGVNPVKEYLTVIDSDIEEKKI